MTVKLIPTIKVERGRRAVGRTVQAIHEDWDREREREVDEISPDGELQRVHYGLFRQLS